MHIEHVAVHLQRRSVEHGWQYSLGEPASESALLETEARLGVRFPEQVKVFYRSYDGLSVETPAIIVHRLEKLRFASSNLLVFATLHDQHDLCFDVSHLNDADQWDIVSGETRYRVTLTMASFWSNKLWAWLDKGRPIWMDVPISQ